MLLQHVFDEVTMNAQCSINMETVSSDEINKQIYNNIKVVYATTVVPRIMPTGREPEDNTCNACVIYFPLWRSIVP